MDQTFFTSCYVYALILLSLALYIFLKIFRSVLRILYWKIK